jgi:hypothetical protein
MGPVQLATAILIGAAGLALWVDVRLGDRGPHTLMKVVTHGAGAFIAVRLMAFLAPAVIHHGSVALTMLALFGLVLPGWIYAFLASLWAMKLVRSALPR